MLFLRNRPSFSADSRLYGFLPLCFRFLRLVFSYSNFTFLNIRPLRSTLLPGTLSRKSKRNIINNIISSGGYACEMHAEPGEGGRFSWLIALNTSHSLTNGCYGSPPLSWTHCIPLEWCDDILPLEWCDDILPLGVV